MWWPRSQGQVRADVEKLAKRLVMTTTRPRLQWKNWPR
jgi:hypothetical protein